MSQRTRLAVVLIALLHAAFFIVYQRPDWEVAWSDQGGYQQLGAGMAKSGGQFTRYPDSPTFIPEVIRTPGYPAFVAVIYKLFGVSTMPVAIAQAFVFVLICFLVYALTARIAGHKAASVARS
jgi:4-amino-4-deoxy-L-arabinose transferase-like glycosyltransferase